MEEDKKKEDEWIKRILRAYRNKSFGFKAKPTLEELAERNRETENERERES